MSTTPLRGEATGPAAAASPAAAQRHLAPAAARPRLLRRPRPRQQHPAPAPAPPASSRRPEARPAQRAAWPPAWRGRRRADRLQGVCGTPTARCWTLSSSAAGALGGPGCSSSHRRPHTSALRLTPLNTPQPLRRWPSPPSYVACRPLLPQQLGGGKLAGINARWRLYRYSPGATYRPHVDGAWWVRGGGQSMAGQAAWSGVGRGTEGQPGRGAGRSDCHPALPSCCARMGDLLQRCLCPGCCARTGACCSAACALAAVRSWVPASTLPALAAVRLQARQRPGQRWLLPLRRIWRPVEPPDVPGVPQRGLRGRVHDILHALRDARYMKAVPPAPGRCMSWPACVATPANTRVCGCAARRRAGRPRGGTQDGLCAGVPPRRLGRQPGARGQRRGGRCQVRPANGGWRRQRASAGACWCVHVTVPAAAVAGSLRHPSWVRPLPRRTSCTCSQLDRRHAASATRRLAELLITLITPEMMAAGGNGGGRVYAPGRPPPAVTTTAVRLGVAAHRPPRACCASIENRSGAPGSLS